MLMHSSRRGGILRKAARLLDREDDYYKLLKRTIDVCKENARELKSIVNRGSTMDDIELLTGRRVKAKKRGRPLGWRKEET